MSKTSKIVIGVSVALLLALSAYALWPKTGNLGGANAPLNSAINTSTDSYLNYGTQDVVGTHIGTSTVGGVFPNPNVTTSFISVIGNSIRQATYQIKIVATTGTDNNMSFTVQGSNDYLCGTQAGNASSTTDVTMKDINWYDAMNHLTGRVQPVTMGNGSSTVIFDWEDTTAGSAKEVTLTNLNYQCLRLLVSASSTLIYAGLNTSR